MKKIILSSLLILLSPSTWSHEQWLLSIEEMNTLSTLPNPLLFTELTLIKTTFSFGSTMAAEENKKRKKNLSTAIQDECIDVTTGMLSSNIVMYFIILTTGTVLYSHGIHHINTVEEAAKALEPLVGPFAYDLFALGIIGTDFLAIPVLCGCLSYILATPLKIKHGLRN